MSKNSSKPTPPSRGIYLLPNLFTISALFSGFFAIVSSMRANYDTAAIAIFICMILDMLDGRIARLIGAQSDFGAQLDSLSDMVSFGIAPALLVYSWSLVGLGKVGWLTAFVYAASTALRLARFNTQLANNDKRYFKGLPCPAAAAVIAGSIWLAEQYTISGYGLAWLMGLITFTVGVLMVTNIRYYSSKDIDFKSSVPFLYIMALVLILVGIATYPALVLTISFTTYAISGPVHTLLRLRQRRKERKSRQ